MERFHIITRECATAHTITADPDLVPAVAFLLNDQPHEVLQHDGSRISPANIPAVNDILRVRKSDLADALASVQPAWCPMAKAAHGLARSLSWVSHG